MSTQQLKVLTYQLEQKVSRLNFLKRSQKIRELCNHTFQSDVSGMLGSMDLFDDR